jgi:hypothetical protein
MCEEDDYADNDLPPPRQLAGYLTPVLTLFLSIGLMFLFMITLILLADRFNW